MSKASRFLSLALCVAMTLTFVVFGGMASAEATATAPIGDQTTPYTVNMYFCGIQPPDGAQRIADAMSKYVQDTYKTNTSYSLHFLNWGTYEQTLNPMIAAGQEFDTAYTVFGLGLDFYTYGPQGAFLDWTPYLQQVPAWYDTFKPYEEKINHYTSGWAPQDANGNKTTGVWLVPTFHDLAIQQCLQYNQTEAQKYGLEDQIKAVKSIDDLTPIVKAYHEANPAGYPFFTASTNGGSIFKIADPSYVSSTTMKGKFMEMYDDKTDTFIPTWTNPSWLNCVNLLNQWYQAGYIPDSMLTTKDSDVLNQATDWLLWVNTNKPGWYESSNANAATKGFKVNLVSIGPVTMGMQNILGAAMSLSKTSGNPARAAYAYELLCSDPVLTNLLVFGVEGTDYSLDSNGQVVPTAGSDYLANGISWQLGNAFIRNTLAVEPKDLGQQYIDWNKSAVAPKNDTFTIAWTDADKAEAQSKYGYDYDAYQAAYTSVDTQYSVKLQCGMLSADDMAAAEKMLTDAGFDKYLQQVNDYYKLWQADPISYLATH